MLSRLRRSSIASILIAAALLEVGGAVFANVVAALSPDVSVRHGEQVLWLVIDLLLIRAIWRRSSTARYVLIALTGIPAIVLVLSVSGFEWFQTGLLLFAMAELLLLFSPQVHTHVGADETRRRTETQS